MSPPALFDLTIGNGPLVVSVPHAGTALPTGMRQRFTEPARALPDTDWLVDQLYAFVLDWDVTVISANFSRYLVDLNRGQDSRKLYANADETGVVPTTTFSGEPIYASSVPDQEEVRQRIRQCWVPYHHALQSQLDRILQVHGVVVLWDAHSIAARVPRFFEGELPALNLGTSAGESCAPQLESALKDVLCESDHSWVCNGRFKGGYITRHYGQPEKNQHAVQLEISQQAYLSSQSPEVMHQNRATELQATLHELLEACLKFAETAGRLRER